MPLKILTQLQSSSSKRQLLAQKHVICHRLLSLVHPLIAQLTLLPSPQNPMLYNQPKSAPPRGGIYIPMYYTWFSRPTQLSIPDSISICLAIFAQLMTGNDNPYILQCVLKSD